VNYKMIGRFISQILAVEAVFLLPPTMLALLERDFGALHAFLITLAIALALSAGLRLLCRGAKRGFYALEGLFCVGIGWVAMGLVGCLPFCLSGQIPRFIDAFFEIVSGFTTTGASIVPEVERLTRSILYWRSFSHWIGGMGVLVFLLAIVPAGSSGFTMHLMRAESPGPNVGKLVPKMRQTAKILYFMYVFLTVLDFLFLIAGKMSVFDAICTAFGTAGTGGFGVRNDSIAGYSPYLQNVCTVFMLLFGVNFSCYYLIFLRQLRSVFEDEELRLYFGLVVGSTLLIVWNLRGFYSTLGETVRHAAFQVASIITTTGFATTDFDMWPSLSKTILLCLMLIGACAGSTGGGIKCARALLLFKSLRRNIRRTMQPQKVQVVRINERVIDEQIVDNTNSYLAAYVIIMIVSFILISRDGFSTGTNISAVFACFNNIGPGLEQVGPACNYSMYGDFSKLVLIFDMLAGRLEIFPILALFSRGTWISR